MEYIYLNFERWHFKSFSHHCCKVELTKFQWYQFAFDQIFFRFSIILFILIGLLWNCSKEQIVLCIQLINASKFYIAYVWSDSFIQCLINAPNTCLYFDVLTGPVWLFYYSFVLCHKWLRWLMQSTCPFVTISFFYI